MAVRPRNATGAAALGAGPLTPAMLALYAQTDVRVSGEDLSVALTLRPGVSVSGQLRFDGATPPPADMTRVRVSLSAVITRGASIGVPPAPVTASGSFSFNGVTPGRYRVTASVPGSSATAGWQPRSALLNGVDVLDLPFDVGTTDVRDLALAFTDHPAEISGVIQDAAGHPTPEYFIVIFAADKSLWSPQSRRIQAKRPSSDGRFTFPNLAPGDYMMAAVTDAEQGEWYDPAFLTQLTPAAIKVTLAEGEKKVQDIRLAGGR